MAVDCGIELKKHNIAVLSLWLGGVSTETLANFGTSKNDNEVFLENIFGKVFKMKDYRELQKLAESVEFSGNRSINNVRLSITFHKIDSISGFNHLNFQI
jgi:hypothetical protein